MKSATEEQIMKALVKVTLKLKWSRNRNKYVNQQQTFNIQKLNEEEIQLRFQQTIDERLDNESLSPDNSTDQLIEEANEITTKTAVEGLDKETTKRLSTQVYKNFGQKWAYANRDDNHSCQMEKLF